MGNCVSAQPVEFARVDKLTGADSCKPEGSGTPPARDDSHPGTAIEAQQAVAQPAAKAGLILSPDQTEHLEGMLAELVSITSKVVQRSSAAYSMQDVLMDRSSAPNSSRLQHCNPNGSSLPYLYHHLSASTTQNVQTPPDNLACMLASACSGNGDIDLSHCFGAGQLDAWLEGSDTETLTATEIRTRTCARPDLDSANSSCGVGTPALCWQQARAAHMARVACAGAQLPATALMVGGLSSNGRVLHRGKSILRSRQARALDLEAWHEMEAETEQGQDSGASASAPWMQQTAQHAAQHASCLPYTSSMAPLYGCSSAHDDSHDMGAGSSSNSNNTLLLRTLPDSFGSPHTRHHSAYGLAHSLMAVTGVPYCLPAAPKDGTKAAVPPPWVQLSSESSWGTAASSGRRGRSVASRHAVVQ